MIVWLASYPRSGNTFLRVILNHLFGIRTYSIYDDRADIGNDKYTSDVVGHVYLPEGFNIEAARDDSSMHYIKTHEPCDDRIADDDRVIYIIRDGRECSVSLVSHQQIYGDSTTELEDVINGNVFGGLWCEHVESWGAKSRPGTLLLHFEELVSADNAQIEKIAQFVGVQKASEQLPTFDELHDINPKFFSSGRKDSWKRIFTRQQHNAFWLKSYQQMNDYGYIDGMPEMFLGDDNVALFRVLSDENKYLRRRFLRSQKIDVVQKNRQISDLRSLLAETREKSISSEKQADQLRRELAIQLNENQKITEALKSKEQLVRSQDQNNGKLQQKLVAAQAETEASQKARNRLEIELKEQRKDNNNLRQKLVAVQDEAEACQISAEACLKARNRLEIELKEQKDNNGKLQQKIVASQDKVEACQKARNRLEVELKEQRDDSSKLQQKIVAAQDEAKAFRSVAEARQKARNRLEIELKEQRKINNEIFNTRRWRYASGILRLIGKN